MLLTGDNAAVAARVAAEVGIAADDVIAGVLPSEKADVIKKLQVGGRRESRWWATVNDAPALAVAADVGIAMAAGRTPTRCVRGRRPLMRGDLPYAGGAGLSCGARWRIIRRTCSGRSATTPRRHPVWRRWVC